MIQAVIGKPAALLVKIIVPLAQGFKKIA